MFKFIGLTLCLFVVFSIMDNIWRLTIFCAAIFIGSTYATYCGEGSQNEYSRCCTDFYNPAGTKACLPCIGSFGVNCSRPCPDGYFGHGCRQVCNCNDTENCNAEIGCIAKIETYNGKGNDVVSGLVGSLVASFCILAMLISGIAFYCLRKQRLHSNPEDSSYVEIRNSQVNVDAITVSPMENTSNCSQRKSFTTSAYIDMCVSNGSMTEHSLSGLRDHHTMPRTTGDNLWSTRAIQPVVFATQSLSSCPTNQTRVHQAD